MSYNYISHNGSISTANKCFYDSNIGYSTDFSVNGEVDGWTYYDGIHTYGCWNNFLFGTLYGDYGVVGRHTVFLPVAAEDYYTVKVVMKINIQERLGNHSDPDTARLMWRTLSDPSWDNTKRFDFTIIPDNKWHTYVVNLGEAQWWQGDINDLRLYPIVDNGMDGDEFFIKSIQIQSVNTFKCRNSSCDYYSNYENPCPGIGTQGSCTSRSLNYLVQFGTTFDFAADQTYTIEKGVNDVLYVDINDYGTESITLSPISNATGSEVAKMLGTEISKVDVGGYAECKVEYNDLGQFIIYSGTYADDSTVVIWNSDAAKTLNFYDEDDNDVSTAITGSYPASGFKPYSNFKIKTHQLMSLIDNDVDSDFTFNPFIYSVEGGRRDWLDIGLGTPSKDVRGSSSDDSGITNRFYEKISNVGSTVIDFNHPFNASGRITKLYAAITLDNYTDTYFARGTGDSNRIATQLSDAKIMFFRPLRNGDLRVLPIELSINNRDHASGKLYALDQEYVSIDCDIFINKGDLMGVYNANVYKGRSITGEDTDALYYQVSGKASGDLRLNQPYGDGLAGLLFYAHGDDIQNRLALEIDLGARVNVEDVQVKGTPVSEQLEYNVARCLDINWEVDLFGHGHTTGYIYRYRPIVKHYFNHPNLFYGKENLSDGIKIVPDGLSAESFSVETGTLYTGPPGDVKNGGRGVIVSGAKYFMVNGDCEWLAAYLHAGKAAPFHYGDFARDPIAFTLHFPYGKEKKVFKSRIYFKEKYNFRSFALSTYHGDNYTLGNADDSRYVLIPNRTDGTNTPWTRILLDGLEFTPEDEYRWEAINLYLADNPSIGHMIYKSTGVQYISYDEDMAYYDELGGLEYAEGVVITNNDQYIQATATDWNIITHEWPEIEAKGFRFYCDYHESTKVCEFEVFCMVEDQQSSMAGSVDVIYSSYGDYWWTSTSEELDNGTVESFVGDTPRYLNIDITPITELIISDIQVGVSSADVFTGDKGCQDTLLPVSAARGKENESSIVYFTNVYGRPYDLYVDIAKDSDLNSGTFYYNKMEDVDSTYNPEIGPDSYYRKHEDFPIRNYQKNVAINCPVYALDNLVDGAIAWYTYDDEYSWTEKGTLVGNTDNDISNLPDITLTRLNFPVLSRGKYWKINFFDDRLSMTVNEMRVYYQGQEIEGIQFYHDKDQPADTGALSDTAPHLNNGIVDGSYYNLKKDWCIGFELPASQMIDNIVLYHEAIPKLEDSHNKAGIDTATSVCIHGDGDTYQTDSIVDESYYEHEITLVGSGIYCDEGSDEATYSFTEDFSDCGSLTNWYSQTGNGSIFTCSSGVLNYAIVTRNNSNDSYYNFARPYSQNARTLDQNFEFTLYFKINPSSFVDYQGNSSNNLGLSVGCLDVHIEDYRNGIYEWDWEPHFGGAQVSFRRDNVGIVIKDVTNANVSETWASLSTVGSDWYCKFTSDGQGAYKLWIWSDAFDGSAQVVYKSLSSSLIWWASKVGIGSGYYNLSTTHEFKNCTGYITDFDFTCYKAEPNRVIGKSSIKFDTGIGEYLQVSALPGPNTSIEDSEGQAFAMYGDNSDGFTFDFWFKLSDYPNSVGEQAVFFKCWPDGVPIENGGGADTSWALVYEVVSAGTRAIRFYCTAPARYYSYDYLIDYQYTFSLNRWHHVYLSICPQVIWDDRCYMQLFIDGCARDTRYFPFSHQWADYFDPRQINYTGQDLKIGENFSGHIDEFRISKTSRVDYYGGNTDDWVLNITKNPPTNQYKRYYTFSVYQSDDNYFFGTYADVDCLYSNSYSYHIPTGYFSDTYYTYYAIDFGKRHDIGIVRSFPVDTSYQFTKTSNVDYSNIQTSDPVTAFASGFTGSHNDARWMRIKMLNGDGTDRVVKKFGVYPEVSSQGAADSTYNLSWTSLGTSITSYEGDHNLALGATISGSTYVGYMVPENAVSGRLGDNINDCWGAEQSVPQWITVHLPQEEEIYRFKIYHGYDGEDESTMVTDYLVQTSTDNQSFTTRFTVTDNDEFERVHDLSSPITARYIRIYITGYKALNRYVWHDEDVNFQYWEGPVIRQIEVYKYYGFTIINSEDTPVIAIDLQDQYFIDSHSLVGIDSEDDSIDWDNSDSNFAYSNSNLSDPKKVDFTSWETDPHYDRWVVIKRNTATRYPTVPGTLTPQTDMPDYLKHVIVSASVDEDGTSPNPVEFPWMWRSNISTLSYDYDNIGYNTKRSLKIEYPASTSTDTISFVEGDHFGWDVHASWRDGLSFDLYIDDINNVDLTEGYIYFGGYDFTDSENSVRHLWNWNTISGSLTSGWNNLSLQFMYSDSVEYTEPTDQTLKDVRRLYKIKFGSLGLVIKGKGVPFVMNVDGFKIRRNHFASASAFSPGLYLHDHDFFKAPIGQFDLRSTTIEFFIRPDWNWDSRDTYRDSNYRSLFHVSNVANDVFGAVVSLQGFEIYYNNLADDFRAFVVPDNSVDTALDEQLHMAFVISNDGSSIGGSGDTIRIYVNNVLLANSKETWHVSDDKHFNFILGGQSLLALKNATGSPNSSSVDAVVSRLKIHSYCKTDFSDSLSGEEDIGTGKLIKPSELISISKDNLTFYRVGDDELPLKFETVAAGTKVPVYVKVELPDSLTGYEKRTSYIVGSWDVGV
jgi:hypothetical protein